MLNISCQSLLACRLSVAKSTDSLMGVPFYVCCFSLVALNVLCLSNFCQFAYMCLGVALLGFILPAALYAFWTWLAISFSMLGKFSALISSNIFSVPFSLLLLGTLIMQMFLCLMLSQGSLMLSSFLFILSLYSVLWQ